MSSIDTRQKLIYGDGALQKASLTYKNAQTGREVTLPVQFNPTEYSISRGLKFKNNAGHGEESHPENTQAADSDWLQLTFRFVDQDAQKMNYLSRLIAHGTAQKHFVPGA